MESKYYMIESEAGNKYIKTWETGCMIVKKTGERYSCENFETPYKKQDGETLQEIQYTKFKVAFLKAYQEHQILTFH